MTPSQPVTASAFAVPPVQDELRRNAIILFEYTASSPYELSVVGEFESFVNKTVLTENTEGSIVQILEDDDGSGWVKVQDADGDKGLVPASYVEASDESAPAASTLGGGTIRAKSAAPTRAAQYGAFLHPCTASYHSNTNVAVASAGTIRLYSSRRRRN